MYRFISFLLTVVILLTRLTSPAQAGGSPCGETQNFYLPIIQANAMAQPSILENLEEIMRADAAFPFDAVITQVFTNTVNVKPIGSRTIIRDVALPEHIKADDLQIGYPVRLGNSGSKVTVTAYFEQFADPESFNYAGLGSKVPGKASLTVKATKAGWVLTWPKVTNATKYLVYQNDNADGDSPELVLTINVTDPNLASYSRTLSFDPPFTYFAVQACNGLLEGDTSLWVTDATPPPAPTWKSHTFGPDGHTMTWGYNNTTDPADVMTYTLYRNVGPSDNGAVEVAQTSNLTALIGYVDSYDYFGVRATDWSGVNHSAIVWTVEYDPTPATPTNLLANMAEGGGFICAWTAPAKAVSYEVQGYLDLGEEGGSWTTYYSGPATMTPIMRYAGISTFRVRAIGFDGSASSWSAGVTDTNPPPQPTLSIVNGAKQVTISLAANDPSHTSIGFSHYILEVADGPSGQNATALDTHATFDSFPRTLAGDTGVTKYYRLTPYDWANNAGPSSAWTPGTPITFGEGGATVQDKFDGYGGSALTPVQSLYWLYIHDFRNNSGSDSWWANWFKTVAAPRSTTVLIDGTTSLHLVSDVNYGNSNVAYYFHPTAGWDYSQDGRFGNDDYIVMAAYVSNTTTLTNIQLSFDVGTDGGLSKTFTGPFVTGWNYLKAKKSEFASWGDPVNWDYIGNLTIRAQFTTATGSPYVDIDDLRIVKAHPDDPSKTSDVGKAWEFAASTGSDMGQWHIYAGNRFSEPGKPFSFGQINTLASPTAWYLAHKPTDVNIVAGTIQSGIFHKENGKNGLAFFIKNVTAGQWTMYAIETDNVADTVVLAKWVNGTRTQLASASLSPFISAAGGVSGQTMWIGVDFSQYDSDNGRIKVYASPIEGNLIQANNLKISTQDSSVGSGGTVGLLSNQAGVRFVNFTAGSPAHADVADVAKSLDGPIIAGDKRRIHYDLTLNRWRYTDDGSTFGELSVLADANKVDKTSANRPGVTRLYRNDNDSNYNVQTFWDGSRWVLQGYVGDSTYHAPCRVAYADNAGALSGYSRYQMMGTGCTVYRSSNLALSASTWTAVSFSALYQSTDNLWNGGTRLTANRTGWHIMFAQANLDTTGNSANNAIRILIDGGSVICQVNERKTADTGNTPLNLFGLRYMYNGQYIEMYALIGAAGSIDMASIPCVMGLICLETA